MINLDTLLDSPIFWIGLFIVIFVVGHFAVDALNSPPPPPKKKGK